MSLLNKILLKKKKKNIAWTLVWIVCPQYFWITFLCKKDFRLNELRLLNVKCVNVEVYTAIYMPMIYISSGLEAFFIQTYSRSTPFILLPSLSFFSYLFSLSFLFFPLCLSATYPPPPSCQSWHDLQIPRQSACKVISALCLFGPALFSYSKACCSSAWERNVSDKPKHISIALTCIPTIIPVSSPSKMLVWAVIHSSESLGHRTGQRKSVNIDCIIIIIMFGSMFMKDQHEIKIDPI